MIADRFKKAKAHLQESGWVRERASRCGASYFRHEEGWTAAYVNDGHYFTFTIFDSLGNTIHQEKNIGIVKAVLSLP